KPAIARRIASESPCCVPTFMRAGRCDDPACGARCASGRSAASRATRSARSIAEETAAAPANWTNVLRSIGSPRLDVERAFQPDVFRRSANHNVVGARLDAPRHLAIEEHRVVAADGEADLL